MPLNSSSENATIVTTKLIHALQHPAPTARFSKIGDNQMEALQHLATIFQHATTNPLARTIALTPIAMRPTSVPRQIPAVSPRVMPTTPLTTRAKPYLITSLSLLLPRANAPDAPELPRVDTPPPASPPLRRSSRKMAPNGPSPAPHRYPLCLQRHLQPTLQRERYANATTFLAQHKANSVVHPITGALQEYCHLMHGTDKSIWSNSLAN